MDFEQLKRRLADFMQERDWEKYHLPKDLVLAIAIETGELGEHFLWRDEASIHEYLKDPGNLREILHEIADILVYSFNLINCLERITGNKIDVAKMLEEKIAINARKYKAENSQLDDV